MFTQGEKEDSFMRRFALCWPCLTPGFGVLMPLASHSAAASSWLNAFLGKVGRALELDVSAARWGWG